jgi:hypothetical protein
MVSGFAKGLGEEFVTGLTYAGTSPVKSRA